ncbi:pentatricopeptide repeat-containing protein At3g49710 [Phragmites australis]|uniref:pentatricopeptide repeat-containing protein At3g49710 n=1 Tax=Phragmites australis TaxID=29695 RepID=UPI002D79E8AD|nr:pentatricopeptide repeat-containing protein At3g49710 [Phragmites australis]
MALSCARGLGAAVEAQFVARLGSSAAAGDLRSGAALHARYAKSHVPPTTFLANHLLLFYSRLDLPALARRLFDEMPRPNVFSHNALLAAHGRARDPRLAAALFSRIPDPDVVSYNTLLAAFASASLAADALRLFMSMRRGDLPVDGFTVSSVISAVTSIAAVAQLHAFAVVSGLNAYVSAKNSLMSGYGKGGLLEEAERMFADMGDNERNHVSWNCMIAVYGQHGHGRKAMELFQDMARRGLTADACTLASVLSAFATAQDLDAGMELHGRLIKSKFTQDPHVASGLVDVYAKCGSIKDAWKAFSEVHKPDLVLWNTLISGYSLHEKFSEEALLCFRTMQRAGFCPDDCSFVCVISGCSNMSSPSQGQQLHALVIKSDIQSNQISVHNAMITLYSRCGKVVEAKMLFDRMIERTTVSYNSIIAGLAQHGHAIEALKLFEDMLNSEYEPTGITFISVLSACAHTGKVDEGWDYFNSMKQKYGIDHCEEHYACMIDLLARAKKFEDAEKMIMKMPFSLSSIGWTSLLGACRTHGNMELGARAAKEILHLSPSSASAPVVLSNMYASAGKWEEAAKIRKLMKDRGIRKKPGCSWIELGRIVHVFVANDVSHPRIKEVYTLLESMSQKMRLAGYVPDVKWALAKDQAAEGETRLRHHSEKLAVAFGLINTKEGEPILVMKNLRICGDCHNAIKIISAITNREITVRDAHRFHCFSDGNCSCGDYW